MILGILSDTHGNTARAATAFALLRANGAAALCHCGDIGSEAVLTELAAACEPEGIPVHCVLGNVDLWDDAIAQFPTTTSVCVHGTRAQLTLDDKRIAILHGHEPRRLDQAVASGEFDYVLTGHTHCREDRRQGTTRLINPGAVHRSAEPSAAVLDLASDHLQYLSILDGIAV